MLSSAVRKSKPDKNLLETYAACPVLSDNEGGRNSETSWEEDRISSGKNDLVMIKMFRATQRFYQYASSEPSAHVEVLLWQRLRGYWRDVVTECMETAGKRQ